MSALRLLAVLLALALAGCVETRFESPIGDNIETCDAGWKGLCLDAEDRDHGDATAFYVNDTCEFFVLDRPQKNGPLKQIHVPVNFVHADRKDYLVVADTAIKGLVDIKAPFGVTPAPEKSYFFARYRLHGDRIDLYTVDSTRTARLVVDGTLRGTVEKTDNELHVYVRGTRAEMLDLVRRQSIFDEKNPLELVRSRQSLDEYERSLLSAANGERR